MTLPIPTRKGLPTRTAPCRTIDLNYTSARLRIMPKPKRDKRPAPNTAMVVASARKAQAKARLSARHSNTRAVPSFRGANVENALGKGFQKGKLWPTRISSRRVRATSTTSTITISTSIRYSRKK